jgi:hypothetical protein
MPDATPLGDIAHVIQLAIAPVFLLTAVCTLLNVLTNRLALSVDRRRILLVRLPELDSATAGTANAELDYLDRRLQVIYTAIVFAVVCALLICLMITVAFFGAFMSIRMSSTIAVFFVMALVALLGSLAAFLREVFLGINTVRCPII